MYKEAVEQLIHNRPRVYSWLGIQQLFLWLFTLSGITFFVVSIYQIISGAFKMIFINQISKQIALKIGNIELQNEISKILQNALGKMQVQLILYSLLLSICCFIIARYCQKVLNRNRYILKLEQIIKEQD